MAQLHFEEQGKPLFVFALGKGRTLIGRADSCDVCLPSDRVSRIHCIVEEVRDPAGWRVLDRSRHGTKVDGERIEAAALHDGALLELGVYTVRFTLAPVPQNLSITGQVERAGYEELVSAHEDAVVTMRAQLRFVDGPQRGHTVTLTQSTSALGGPGATIELDQQLPPDSARVRVVRGRPMVEPLRAAVYLAGQRVRDITPVLPGEEVQVGQHLFVLEAEPDEETPDAVSFGDMVGASPAMRRLFGVLRRVAAHDSPVLLIGESGTGKELAARAVHDASEAHARRFVAVNCAAIAPNLVESELFGHEKGAFTGATTRKDGAFHHAEGGTLFLDELGEMPLELQPKLLRALVSGEVRRVGGLESTFPDVRVISATHRNLQDMVQRGTFREALYWRLSVLTVRVPALRERPEDIALLARTLLARHHPDAQLADTAIQALEAHHWPGNVRELRNVLTRAYVLGGASIGPDDLSFHPWAFDEQRPPAPLPSTAAMERKVLEDALERARGNRAEAARQLGIARSTLLYRLRKHGIG